jgi:transposase
MSRTSNDLRKVFLNLYNKEIKPVEIANILNVTRQTITNWIRKIKSNNEEKLFDIYKPKGHPLTLNIDKLKQEFETNKTAYNREIAEKFNSNNSTIAYWRHKLGYTNKKGRATYRESNPELKKSI